MDAVVITGVLLLLAIVATFADWRRGLFVVIPIALLQDPLRKLTPGEPVVYILLAGLVLGTAVLTASMSGISLLPKQIWGWRRYLSLPFGFLIGIILLQAINSLTRFGNVFIPLIGLLAYLTPFVALGLVYQTLLRSPEYSLNKFLRFYVMCVSVWLTTILLQFVGYDWAILGEVGQGLVIFDRYSGSMLRAYSGLFRSSEVAAWHAATCVCFFAILMINRRMTVGKGLAAGIFVLMIIGLGMLTGRRKFLVEILIFVSAYGVFLLYFGRGASRLAMQTGLVGTLGYFAFILWIPETPTEGAARTSLGGEQYDEYVARTQTVIGWDVPERFVELGVAPVTWAYNQYGLLGAGLGVGSQGVHLFGAEAQGAAEGGLGKIWLELGAPGFVIVAWFGWALVRHIWYILNFVNARSRELSRICGGLASFLVANTLTFAVATQVFSDIFVLSLIGTALAALCAMPIFAERALQRRVLSLAPNSAAVLRRQPA